MTLIRARQPALTRLFPHNGNRRFLIPRAGARPPAVQFSPAPGTFTESQSVTMTCADPLALIYYTVDGTFPDNVYLYDGPVEVLSTVTLRAVAKYPGGMPGAVTTGLFTINSAANFVRWEFDTSLDGWQASGGGNTFELGPVPGTATMYGGGLGTNRISRTVATAGQTGQVWRYISVNFKRITDTVTTAQPRLQWSTAEHTGYSDSYSLILASAPVADGVTYQHDFDMWDSPQAADWKASDITGILWSPKNSPSVSQYEVNWIEVRKDDGAP